MRVVAKPFTSLVVFPVVGRETVSPRIHRNKLMFHWITKHHEIVVGFIRKRYGKCEKCGRSIPEGETMCDQCFAKDKEVSAK